MKRVEEMKRQTGRTARMIEAAILSERAGNKVFIMTAIHEERRRIMDQLPHGSLIRVETPVSRPDFDWRWMKAGSGSLYDAWFVDHHAIEEQWRPVLETWCAFDLQPGVEGMDAEAFTQNYRCEFRDAPKVKGDRGE